MALSNPPLRKRFLFTVGCKSPDNNEEERIENVQRNGITGMHFGTNHQEETSDSIVDEFSDVDAEYIDSSNNVEQFTTTTTSNDQFENDLVDLDAETPTDLVSLKKRIERNMYVLSNFSKHRNPVVPRHSYVSILIKDISLYYGYSEYLLSEHLYHLFPLPELLEFLEASEQPRPVTIRTNTLKIKRRKDLAKALLARGINVDPLAIEETSGDDEKTHTESWSSLGLQVFSDGSNQGVPLGATPEYLAGLYMIQAAASLLPVVSLAPAPGERILDMCAAPGGKSTHCAQLMKNSGILVSNDLSKDRQRATCANFFRMGVRNAITCFLDGRSLTNQFSKNFFDRVLLDAPCSGTGIISKDPSVKVSKTEADFKTLTHTQKELILTAIDLAAPGNGVIIYSTCSVCVEENEQVVQYALEKRPNVKLVETKIPFGRPGFVSYRGRRFSPLMKLTMRYYPHLHNLDGFYVAKLIKTSNLITSE